MENVYVDSLIENIITKIFIEFYFIKFMIHLAWVANSMVIFSASCRYPVITLTSSMTKTAKKTLLLDVTKN